MYFVHFERVYNHVPQGVLWRMVHEYGHQSCYHKPPGPYIIGVKLNAFPVGVGLCQGCHWIQVLKMEPGGKTVCDLGTSELLLCSLHMM